MGFNLTNEQIDETFGQLTQISGSYLVDGTGSLIEQLSVSASYANEANTADSATTAQIAISSSYAINAGTSVSASYALNSTNAVNATSALTATSASYATNAQTSTNAVSASIAGTANIAIIATSASHALNADNSISSSYSVSALSSSFSNVSISSSYATTADTSISSSQAESANNAVAAISALVADNAISSSHALVADLALTASIVTDSNIAYKNQNNIFTGTQSFDTITANSASFGTIQTITGSATIIGDSIIVLNNDTPTQRYAGVAVYDSGSTGVTASLEFDGLSNDWFYEYSDDGGVTTDHGVVMFGPEYSVKGTPTYPSANTLLKGNGGHHVEDSSITDTGALVTVNNPLTVTGQINGNLTGNVTGNASTATTASYALVSNTSVSASYATVAENLTPGDKTHAGSIKQTFAAPATDTQVDLIEVTGATAGNTNAPYNNFTVAIQDYPGFGNTFKDVFAVEKYDSFGYNYGSAFYLSGTDVILEVYGRNGGYGVVGTKDQDNGIVQTVVRGNQLINFANGAGGYTDQFYDHPTSGRDAQIVLKEYSTDTTQTEIAINGDNIGIGNYSYQSAGNGAVTIGNSVTTNIIKLTGKTVGHSNSVTEVVGGNSDVDFSKGNYFILAMTGNTTLRPINIDTTNNVGQTVSVRVNTGGNTLTFDSSIKWQDGTAPTLTGTAIITFITFAGDNVVYATSVNNLS